MSADQLDGLFHVTLAAVGLFAWAMARRAVSSRGRVVGYLVVAIAGVVAFPGFDRITGRGLAHPSELFHYAFGATYFPELGYDGLYDATTRIDAMLDLAMPSAVRDLASGRIGTTEQSLVRGERVERRFSNARWRELEHDVVGFHDEYGDVQEEAVLDHGFNATPPWIAVARLLLGGRVLTIPVLRALPLFDVAMLVALAALVLAGFGLERGALAIFFAGTAYTFRFAWIGGSFLRFDWLLALGVAMVALRRGRHALAGGALAVATASRIFPFGFALAAGLSLLAESHRSRDPKPMISFVSGFAAIAAIALAIGVTAGRGVRGYGEFLGRFETHRATWAANHVGLDTILVVDRIAGTAPSAGPSVVDAFDAYAAPIAAARADRRPALALLAFATLAAVALAASRLRPEQAMPLGAAIVFSTSTISGYYWAMLSLAPLVAPARTIVALVACSFLHAFIELALGSLTAAHVVVSFAIAAIFVDWIATAIRIGSPAPAGASA